MREAKDTVMVKTADGNFAMAGSIAELELQASKNPGMFLPRDQWEPMNCRMIPKG